jgi:ATP-dependent DNA helicase RecQ
METALDTLKKYWGFTSFRPLQETIINEIVNKRDVLALMPTGGGKSMTYQVPGIMLDGICIVVSPLIALIKDQVENLRSRAISADYVVSGMDFKEIDRILDNCVYGGTKFLYVSPERLKSELFIERFKLMKVSFIAVDEAHCISQWGYDFRPSYIQISAIREFHPNAPILALTASATLDVVEDIQQKLAFKKKNLQSTSFARESLHYVIIKEDNKRERILKGLQLRSGSGIIYVRSRKLTRELSQWLISKGISASPYNAGLSPEIKDKIQEDWKNEKIRIIVATNAFGMGIDKANVRTVIHYDIPDSIEAYFQEVGRAGRDGLKAYGVMLYNDSDLTTLKERIERSFPPIENIKKVYKGIANLYQLAHGSGLYESRVFDITKLAERVELPVLEVFNSIKILERNAFYQLSDSLHQPSKIKIKVNQSDLYYFEVANPQFELLLKTLLRSYSGLFDSYVRLNEYQIAKRMSEDVNVLVKQLKYLDSIELIEYLPANDKPQITFLSEIVPDDRLHISHETYGAIKERQIKRSEAMIHFIKTEECRSIQLLRYFGEPKSIPCGKCDVCLRKNRSSDYFKELEVKLKSILKSGAKDTKTILKELPIIDEVEIIDLLRNFSDEGLVSLGDDNKWRWD